MGCRHGGLSMDECILVMKSIAKFHALSYAKYKGDYLAIKNEFPFLEEKMFKKTEEIPEMQKQWTKTSLEMEAKLLRDTNKDNENEASAIEKFYGTGDDYFNKLYDLIGAPVPNAVIGHGDCWTNNFLFKYDEVTGKPIDLKFLDFQISRVSSRTIDLNYFLYSSPKLEILNTKEEALLRVYYDEFEAFIKKLGCTQSVSTFEEFLEEYNSFRGYGLAMG